MAVDPGEELDYDDVLVPEEDSGSGNSFREDMDLEPEPETGAVNSSPQEQLGGCSVEQLLANPQLQSLLNKMVNERIQREKAQMIGESSKSTVLTSTQQEQRVITPRNDHGKRQSVDHDKLRHSVERVGLIKSPSDTTIYVPALRKKDDRSDLMRDLEVTRLHEEVNQTNDIINKISNFVESVRQDDSARKKSITSEIVIPGQEEARGRTQKVVIEAEKFRAAIAQPSGRNDIIDSGISDQLLNLDLGGNAAIGNFMNERQVDIVEETQSLQPQVNVVPAVSHIGMGQTDDDFFHLTCHIDQTLQQKIEKGQYVDLDKLLPRDRLSCFDGQSTGAIGDENKFEWVQRDGGTFLMPAKRSSRITSFRKWEQAFRVYATIYCSENPNRSREIWQYISVINTAASSFVWDNVYSYDIIFRQLMEFNPARSWAVTYNQMWNLSMRDPLPNRGQKFVNNFGQSNFSGNNSHTQSNSKTGRKTLFAGRRTKSDYCWNFNKGIKCKWGKNCRFIEHCSYCDSSSHGVNTCPKLEKKDKDGNSDKKSAGN